MSMYMYVLVCLLGTHSLPPPVIVLHTKKALRFIRSPMYLCSRLSMSLLALYVLVYVCLYATCFICACIHPYKKGYKKSGEFPRRVLFDNLPPCFINPHRLRLQSFHIVRRHVFQVNSRVIIKIYGDPLLTSVNSCPSIFFNVSSKNSLIFCLLFILNLSCSPLTTLI